VKSLGHYTLKLERAGMKIKVSSEGFVALLSVVAGTGMLAAYLFW